MSIEYPQVLRGTERYENSNRDAKHEYFTYVHKETDELTG